MKKGNLSQDLLDLLSQLSRFLESSYRSVSVPMNNVYIKRDETTEEAAMKQLKKQQKVEDKE